MKRLFAFLQRRRKLLLLLGLCIVLGVSAGLVVKQIRKPDFMGTVNEVWLPMTGAASFPGGRVSAIEKVQIRQFDKYGQAIVFTSTEENGMTIFEALTGHSELVPAKCPGVFIQEKASSPTECTKVGEVDGASVYSNRTSLGTTRISGYMERGKTFIAFEDIDGSEETMLKQAEAFVRVPDDRVPALLAANKTAAERINAKVRAAEETERRKEAEAYKLLPFTPILPASLPTGWRNSRLEVTGVDPLKPQMVEAVYVNSKEQYITVFNARRADFTLGATCGPTPKAVNPAIACGPVAARDYYQGAISGQDYTAAYIFRPMGDAMAIVYIYQLYDEPLQTPGPVFSNEDWGAFEAIALALRPAGKSALKGAGYFRIAYY